MGVLFSTCKEDKKPLMAPGAPGAPRAPRKFIRGFTQKERNRRKMRLLKKRNNNIYGKTI